MTKRRNNQPPKIESLGYELRLPALEVHQGPSRTLYSFAVDGKQLPLFTAVSRIHRSEDAEIRGYQRPEVLAHISSIRRYLESEEPMIPNALVVAFDKRVTFERTERGGKHREVCPGTLIIPIVVGSNDEDKPGWLVDGQQRCAAIRDAHIKAFPMCVTAFIADSDEEQRSQFILVNSTKPLPKGLIHELLPSTRGTLPRALQTRRFPALLLDRLNYVAGSPLEGMINTPTTPGGVIKDNSMLRLIENSLSDGALYQFRNAETGEGDADAMLALLMDFWRAVSIVFDDAWALPPRKSRLMHGVGVTSLGFLMDAIVDRYRSARLPTETDFASDLRPFMDICHWTSGSWDFGYEHQRQWNHLQNTPKDIQLLTDYLLAEYRTFARTKLRRSSSPKRQG